MIPMSSNSTENATKRGRFPSKTWFVDRERGRIVKQCDGFDSIYQSVQKILLTERYSEQIYSTFYGVELRSMIGKPTSYIKAALPQAVKEALKQDDRIQSVSVENIEVNGDSVAFTVDVQTNMGNYTIQTGLTI